MITANESKADRKQTPVTMASSGEYPTRLAAAALGFAVGHLIWSVLLEVETSRRMPPLFHDGNTSFAYAAWYFAPLLVAWLFYRRFRPRKFSEQKRARFMAWFSKIFRLTWGSFLLCLLLLPFTTYVQMAGPLPPLPIALLILASPVTVGMIEAEVSLTLLRLLFLSPMIALCAGIVLWRFGQYAGYARRP